MTNEWLLFPVDTHLMLTGVARVETILGCNCWNGYLDWLPQLHGARITFERQRIVLVWVSGRWSLKYYELAS
jgi:hypothetical protein